jgi:hypothetical protein
MTAKMTKRERHELGLQKIGLRFSLAIALVVGVAATIGHAQSAPGATPTTPAPAAEAAPLTRKGAAAQWTEDGLQSVKISGLDVVYVRPGASLAGYDKFRLPPISVAFRKNWDRSSGIRNRVRAEDTQRIKDRLATLARAELVKELGAGGYTLSEQGGDKVLELDIRIIDLDVTAPDIPTAGRQTIYAVSAGQMTLVAELRDSVSGETIMRIYDHDEGDNSSRLRQINNIENQIQARQVVGGWARALRKQLDLARDGSKG